MPLVIAQYSKLQRFYSLLFDLFKVSSMHHVAVAVISNFISSALGFVLNKARNKVAEKLKEKGDVTDEKLRNAIIEDLNDIKKKRSTALTKRFTRKSRFS